MTGSTNRGSDQAADFTPPANAFSHCFRVPSSAIDVLGHASNVEWLQWVIDAAEAHSRSVGLSFEEYQRLGCVWVVRKHELEYLAEALEGETITAHTWIADIRAATSLRRTRFERDGKVLARGQTRWVLLSAVTRKPTRVPKELLARYGFGGA